MTDKLQTICKEAVLAKMRYYPSSCPKSLRKTHAQFDACHSLQISMLMETVKLDLIFYTALFTNITQTSHSERKYSTAL